jgi:putative hydrolase of HD superfamily
MKNLNRLLKQQVSFIHEIDKVKAVLRKTRLFDGSRHENDAEHAWHICVMAMVLAGHANKKNVDISRVIRMLLIHDIVEIDTDDVLVYDTKKRKENRAKEQKAARRIFGLLPKKQGDAFLRLYREFEARKTAEAKFAAALDRLEPIMQNYYTSGYAWKKHNITRDRLLSVNRHIAEGSETLWQLARGMIEETVL